MGFGLSVVFGARARPAWLSCRGKGRAGVTGASRLAAPMANGEIFVIGSGGSLRRGDLTRTDMTVKGYDQDYVFMLAEIAGDEFYYAAVSRKGQIVDSGVFKRPTTEPSPKP